MPALSFQEEFVDALLRCDKQQTTRPQTDRFKVGDIGQIYIQQRRRIADKPLRLCTDDGKWCIRELMNKRHHYPQTFFDRDGDVFYPHRLDWEPGLPQYYAHFLGKVEITATFDICPREMSKYDLQGWAQDDGFDDFHPTVIPPDRLNDGANMWFIARYGDDWMKRMWTVIRWDGWIERYFKPDNGGK